MSHHGARTFFAHQVPRMEECRRTVKKKNGEEQGRMKKYEEQRRTRKYKEQRRTKKEEFRKRN